MNDWIIKAEALNKSFQLYANPKARLKQAFLGPFGASYYTKFDAIKDLNFEIRQGESFGIVGRNGAGKSTLLQMIAGTLQPTSGIISVKGRVAALLELGSGFNPEFTGRENIKLNASILGMNLSNLPALMEEIIEFAEIGKFIDQPVKTYSSGMMLRLAFSVIVHLEPEILIVDEALAVGDIGFVGKCLNRVSKFIREGGTLLFVSHDIDMVKNITDKVLYLENGDLVYCGNTPEGIAKYRSSFIGPQSKSPAFTSPKFGASIETVESEFKHPGELSVKIKVKSSWHGDNLIVGFNVYNYLGIAICGSSANVPPNFTGEVLFHTSSSFLSGGSYSVSASIKPKAESDLEMAAWWKNASGFEVQNEANLANYNLPFTIDYTETRP